MKILFIFWEFRGDCMQVSLQSEFLITQCQLWSVQKEQSIFYLKLGISFGSVEWK